MNAPDRVEFWDAVWRTKWGRPHLYTDVITRAWLEPTVIRKRSFRLDVYVFSEGRKVFETRLDVPRLASYTTIMASPLGVVLA